MVAMVRHHDDTAFDIRVRRRNRLPQISGESCNSTAAGQRVADKRHTA
jgi:hypothetical protein